MTSYADALRSRIFTGADIASLIEGIFTSGFPTTFLAWTPTYGASGSMTFTSVSTAVARYIRIGKLIWFYLDATGTTGGVASTDLTHTLPIASLGTGFVSCSCAVSDSNIISGTNRIGSVGNIRKYDSSNWGLGAGRQIITSGFYEAA